MKLKSVLLIAISALALMACDKKSSHTPGDPSNGGSASPDTVATFRYFRGGFYAPPDVPNWTDDMTITFTTSGFFIEAKHADPLCGKSGTYTEAEAAQLFNMVSQLLLRIKDASTPNAPDAGVEYIEITLSSGEKRKYHLMNMDVPNGELYATNPATLSTYLKDLEDSLATACQ